MDSKITFEFINLNKVISVSKINLGHDFRLDLLDKNFDIGTYISNDKTFFFYNLLEVLKDNNFTFYKENFTEKKIIKIYIKIAIKFSMPYWIIEKLFFLKKNNDMISEKINQIFNSHIKLCKICGKGYNERDNKPNSCRVHKEALKYPFETFSCCGVAKEDGINNPCCIGYHFEDTELIIKNINNLSFKITDFL